MLVIFGNRTIRTGKFSDNDHVCYHCQAYDREVQVSRTYFHFCFIPVFPIGGHRMEMRCRNCGDQTEPESVKKQYQGMAKTPIYLYSAPILLVCVTAYWFYWNGNNEKEKRAFVDKPAIGDVYTIKKGSGYEASYSFLRVITISGDSVMLYHNDLEYGGFVSKFTDDDYFVKDDTLVFKRNKLKEMLEQGGIYSVKRGYGIGSGFNSIR
ncbi:MAG: zinc-ribbon domain-containing protein [Bacteroidota bacterium]|nr:zinc-ribbon domain-containing protein [Bacteroidota bacterium]